MDINTGGSRDCMSLDRAVNNVVKVFLPYSDHPSPLSCDKTEQERHDQNRFNSMMKH